MTNPSPTPFGGSRLVIGHRGAAGLVPENTLPGFERAVSLGVDAVELDVHVCGGRLVVIHDETLERTTNGTGAVAERTPEALRALDAGDGAQIPYLEEVLAAVPETVGVNVELKGAGTAAPLARLLEDEAWQDRPLLISSFDHGRLEEFGMLAPAMPVAPLFHRWPAGALDRAERMSREMEGAGRFVNLSRRLITKSRCDDIRARGFKILVYTVNDPLEAETFFGYGVSGVFTDFPDQIGSGSTLQA